jgi:hypothetical protein
MAALVALLSMLFMQLAVAAYACPNVSSTSARNPGATAGWAQPNCVQLDPAHPSLCQVQSDAGAQSLGKLGIPDLPVVPGVARIVPLPQVASDRAISSPRATPELYRVTSPPLAIRYCSFQI